MFDIRSPKTAFNDSKSDYFKAKAKLLEIVESWTVKESKQRKNHLIRLETQIKALKANTNGLISNSVKKTLKDENLGSLKQETTEKTIFGITRTKKSDVPVLIVETTKHAEKLLLLSQTHLHEILRKHTDYYVKAVREIAEEAGKKRFQDLKTAFAELDPSIQPEFRKVINQVLEDRSSDIRKIALEHIQENVSLEL
jgi:hypothetical protein